MKINIPKNVNYIIESIEKKGYEAFIVGGCVRDSLLNLEPNDYDITTSAKPNVILDIFKNYKTMDNGIKHGTVGIIIDNKVYEITTYRVEGEYEDNRRPESVDFTKELKEDLKRRDFTVNAMAYNHKTGLVDLYGGQNDLKYRLIKTVGNSDDRFEEDGLRLIRAIRFSAKLGFELEQNTLKSIYKNAFLIKNISRERISEEISKIILSNNPEKIEILNNTLMLRYLDIDFNLDNNKLKVIKYCEYDLSQRLALIKYLNFKYDEKSLKDLSDKLVISNKIYKKINNLFDFMILNTLIWDKIDIKIYLSKKSREDLLEGLKLKKIYYNYYLKTSTKHIEKIYINLHEIEKNNECYNIKNLNINGNDLKDIGYKGAEIGGVLNLLLNKVINNPNLNKKEKLLEIINR